jgi:hypothetical protein
MRRSGPQLPQPHGWHAADHPEHFYIYFSTVPLGWRIFLSVFIQQQAEGEHPKWRGGDDWPYSSKPEPEKNWPAAFRTRMVPHSFRQVLRIRWIYDLLTCWIRIRTNYGSGSSIADPDPILLFHHFGREKAWILRCWSEAVVLALRHWWQCMRRYS